MERFIERIYSKHSTFLNMTRISESQKELSYITRMRNLILFQVSSREEFQYLRRRFCHQIWVHTRSLPIFRICYSHAFFQVVKSHVLVHNYEPFRHWDMIVIYNDGHQLTKNGFKIMIKACKDIEEIPVNTFLVANNGLASPSIPNGNFYPYYKGILAGIQSDIFEQFYADSYFLRHESTWRRVYCANKAVFFCEYNDFSLYVIEQKCDKTSINVFKTILEREIGMCFNQKSVLKTIASPYYYILPYQDERKYAEYVRYILHNEIDPSDFRLCEIECQLELAVKSLKRREDR
ncbi:uncharacterized protein TNIN_217791 [Trichonephila inaurata madagascariensis]|uniref:Uncharacterized protein n=1 Tax=Trichonephila inaurata madagascariensis TaxID=2747483 RepID=A0A8X6YAU6_9ARAC|nr:uncharacterized protein TNIN_87051 [Trichonephila inaurata madagascariensis]GFY78881.1 uncharacterized protein TNIN_217791 [Trichonephila inaurata madagascariensis]